MKKRGLTLIEILVAIAIIAILTSIAIPNFSCSLQKNRMKNDIEKIYTALLNAKYVAFNRKIDCEVDFDSTTFKNAKIKCGNYTIGKIELKEEFKTNINPIKFHKEGFTSSLGSIYPNYNNTSCLPKYSCIIIHRTRITKGEWNGTNCSP
ncbi:prepilin-type N-terminal cleavage/methylation domain-containing protein [Thermodesulfatator indicus]